jgi:hypothetical protein
MKTLRGKARAIIVFGLLAGGIASPALAGATPSVHYVVNPYPGALADPGTVFPDPVDPSFAIPANLAAQLQAIYGTLPIVVANQFGRDKAPLSFGGIQDGTKEHPSSLDDNEQYTPVPGTTAYFGISLGSGNGNQRVESGVTVPGGRVVELSLYVNKAGNIVFHMVLLPGNSVSINGSTPIPLHYGQNYLTVWVLTTKTVSNNSRHSNVVTKKLTKKVLILNVPRPPASRTPMTGGLKFNFLQSKLSGYQRNLTMKLARDIVAKGYTKVVLVGYANVGENGAHPAAFLSQYRAFNLAKELRKDLLLLGNHYTKVTSRAGGGTSQFGNPKTEDGRAKNRTVAYTAKF